MKYFYCLFFALIFFIASHAYAQCAMPNGPDAGMGVIIFNKDHKVMQYCNGDKWVGLWGGRGGGGITPPVCDQDTEKLHWTGNAWQCVAGGVVEMMTVSGTCSVGGAAGNVCAKAVQCPDGYIVTGGGAMLSSQCRATASAPSGDTGWSCRFTTLLGNCGTSATGTCYARCLRLPS